MTATFTAVDGSTVTPRTRADLMKHPAFAGLRTDTEGNPCVWMKSHSCDDCDEEWDDDWSCECDDECPKCGAGIAPHESQWLPDCPEDGPIYDLWFDLPEAGSPEADKAANDALMADHAAHVDRRDTATILAALRAWQALPNDWKAARFMDIATDGGEIEPMTAEEIDRLCDQINPTMPPAQPRPMWLFAYTENHGDNDLRDHYTICLDEAEARAKFDAMLATSDILHCAAIAPVSYSTEPHWQSQA